MEISQKTLRSIFFRIVGCILLYWLLHETTTVAKFLTWGWQIISPFAAGTALALILNVPMRAIERRLDRIQKPGVRRGVAILLTILCVFLLFTLVINLLLPQLERTVRSIIASLPDFFRRTEAWFHGIMQEHPDVATFVTQYTELESFDWNGMVSKLATLLETGVTTLVNRALSMMGSVINGLINFVISLAFAIYGLAQKETLCRQTRMLLYAWLPEVWADRILKVARLTNRTFSNFISGQCMEACIFGSLVAVTMLVFRIPYVSLVGVLAAVTALIPLVGALVGWVLGTLFILVQSPSKALWFMILYLVDQQLEDNLIYPKVVGSSIGLPSMWVLVAVALGGALQGVVGMLLMIPAASVLYNLLRELTWGKLKFNGVEQEKFLLSDPETQAALHAAPTPFWAFMKNHPVETTLRWLRGILQKLKPYGKKAGAFLQERRRKK